MPKVITLTLNPALDLSVEVDAVVPEDKLRTSAPEYDPGGGGINVARVITRLGGEAFALYPSGGHSGRVLDERLGGEGVHIESVPVESPTRQNFSAFERSSGRQFRFVLPGPRLGELEVQALMDRLDYLSAGAEYVVASGSLPDGLPDDFYARVARLAKKRGARFVLDTSGAALERALEEGVYMIKPNGKEFEALARDRGLPPEAARDGTLERALLEKRSVEAVALTLGARGAVLATREGRFSATPPPHEVRSSVGAGDSFLGGFVAGLLRGYALKDAFRYAMAAAAATMLSPGTALCTPEDTERFFRVIQVS